MNPIQKILGNGVKVDLQGKNMAVRPENLKEVEQYNTGHVTRANLNLDLDPNNTSGYYMVEEYYTNAPYRVVASGTFDNKKDEQKIIKQYRQFYGRLLTISR